MTDAPRTNDPLDEAFAAYLRTCDAGELSSREEFLQQFPELADELKQLIEAADMIGQVSLGGGKISSSAPSKPHDETIGANVANGDSDPAVTLPMAHRSSGDRGPTLPYDLGDYILLEVIGRGGMGVVYLAKQHELDRHVAVKMIRSGILADESEVRRFYMEAKAAARLRHRGIVGVHQFGRLAGHHFFSMEYIRGTDLQRKISSSIMDPEEAARYVRDVARAIHHAHQNGVLHRDLKPANVLIDEQHQIHVTDFGLAKHMDSDSSVTGSGAAIGTPHYMAPEQAGGHSDRACRQSDVYSMGAILFACVTGRPPLAADTVMQTLVQVVHHPAPSARSIRADIPIDLETIIAKCLEKPPGKRYESAEQLADELDAFLEGRPISARPRSRAMKAWHWFEGVPVVGALTGRRVLHSSTSHRRFQAAMLLVLLLSPLLMALAFLGLQQWNSASSVAIPTKVRIAGGVRDGVYREIAQMLKHSIELKNDGVTCDVVQSHGSENNAELLINGVVDLACIQENSPKNNTESLRLIAPLYYERFHAFARKDSKIESIDDFASRRVALGPPGSGSRVSAKLLLEPFPELQNKIKDDDSEWDVLFSDTPPDGAIICMGESSTLINRLLADDSWQLLPINAKFLKRWDASGDVRTEWYDTGGGPGFKLETTAMLMARENTPDDLVIAALEAWYDGPIHKGDIPIKSAASWHAARRDKWHEAAVRFYSEHVE